MCSDPQISPDGAWVAYAVRSNDVIKDKRVSHVWMTSWDGKETVQLTHSEEGEDTPRWSPDGRLSGTSLSDRARHPWRQAELPARPDATLYRLVWEISLAPRGLAAPHPGSTESTDSTAVRALREH